MRDLKWQVVGVILVLLAGVASIFAVTDRFVGKAAYEEFKSSLAGQFMSFNSRLVRIEDKQDVILQELRHEVVEAKQRRTRW